MTAPPILRAAGDDALLARLDPELVQAGRLYILSAEAIRERSGGRWSARQDVVWEFAERQFQKDFPSSDHLVRLDDVHFLLIQPLQTSEGAQGASLRLLREVLRFFLGAAARADLKLSRVTDVGPDGVRYAPIEVSEADFASLEQASAAHTPRLEEPAFEAKEDCGQDAAPLLAAIQNDRTPPRRTLVGERTYEITLTLEPLWCVRSQAVVSHRLKPSVCEGGADSPVPLNLLPIKDLIRLDLIVLSEVQRLMQTATDGPSFALQIPIHQATLTTAAGRRAALWALERLQPWASSYVVVSVVGLDPGTPQSSLIEVTSVLGGRCRAVVAEAPSLAAMVERWRGARLGGVSLDLDAVAGPEFDDDPGALSRFADRAAGVGSALILHAIKDRPSLLRAWAAGFTHLGGDVISDRLKQPLAAVRFYPRDLYVDGRIG